MLCLARPKQDILAAFDACRSIVRNVDLGNRLASVRGVLPGAEDNYVANAAGSLHLIAQEDSIDGVVTANEMVTMYDSRMVRSTSPGRAIYDEILISAPLGRCSLCGTREVSTLDHFLAKTLYPHFAVCPINLVPCCAECNKAKGALYPTNDNDQFFHPYFDDLSAKNWLHCEVLNEEGAVFQYSIREDDLSDNEVARLECQFAALGLARLYSSHAATQLAVHRGAFEASLDAGGPAAVRNEVERLRDSAVAFDMNCWQAGFYAAGARSNWFCEGGFSI